MTTTTAARIMLVTGLLFAGTIASEAATGLEWIDANTNLTLYGDLSLR